MNTDASRTEFGRELAASVMAELKGHDIYAGVVLLACVVSAMEQTARGWGREPDRQSLFAEVSRLIDDGVVTAHSIS